MTDTTIYRYSRCKSGKQWFWCVYTFDEWVNSNGTKVRYEGYAAYSESCRHAALFATGGRIDHQDPNYFASGLLRRRAIEKRKNRTTNTTDTNMMEFVYDYSWDCERPTLYRIVKKTKKRVFIDKDSWHATMRSCRDAWDVSTWAVDREKFEREGTCRIGTGTARRTVYASPERFGRHVYVPTCLSALGLANDATRGGDPEQFKILTAHYDDAITRCSV